MSIRVSSCTRCGNKGETVFLINVRPGGHSTFSSQLEVPPPPKDENVCATCLTNTELGRMLHPVAGFVLSTVPRDPDFPSTAVALETVTAIFQVRCNDQDGNRSAALRAVGFDVI